MSIYDEIDPETLQKARWLQTKIYEQGLDPVWFMRAARRYAESEGTDVVGDAIGRRL